MAHRLRHIAVILAAGALAAACETSTGNGTGGGATLPTDTGSAGGDSGGGGQDASGGADTSASGGDAAVEDVAKGDGGVSDAGGGQDGAAVKDSTVTQDIQVKDTAPGDTAPSDTAPGDTSPGDTSKDGDGGSTFSCGSDAQCAGLVFSTCNTAKCVAGTCTVNHAADGAACSVAGPCGGSGTCKAGQCAFASACAPKACTPTALKCGDKITLSAASMGASVFSTFPCASGKWTGGDKVYDLANDTTQIAAIELAGTGTWTVAEIAVETLCNASTCPHASATKLQLGLQPKKVRRLVVDSQGSGSVTLSVTCSSSNTGCGDGKCGVDEACWSCPKDCGACTTCGDGKCDATKMETCSSCAKDCGACKPACPAGSTKGCAGNPCEACVCATDPFCCNTSWDNLCASACTSCNTLVCGDGKCADEEKKLGCVQDCPKAVACGDGTCAGSETCSSCAKDCGMCAGKVTSYCGDAKCDSNENCASCAQDCGKCGDYACACKADSYCCQNKFDSVCNSACGKCAGGLCPVVSCGDGLCNGGETCANCSSDCGACKCGDGVCTSNEDCTKCAADCGACKCGDGKCTTGEDCATCAGDCGGPCKCGNGKCEPGETASSCAADCAVSTGCKGKCGSSSPSKEADGSSCYCDDYCVENDDCCADFASMCP